MSRLVRWLPVATVLVLLGAAIIAAASSEITVTRGPAPVQSAETGGGQEGERPSPAPIPPGGLPEEPISLPSWLGLVVAVLCSTVVAVLLGTLLWIALRDRLTVRRQAPDVADPEVVRRRMRDQVRAAVDEGLTDLDVEDGDPRRAVIACWARLEAAAAAAGTPREPGDTSTELVARLLSEHAITAPVLDGFAAVYRRARFATGPIDAAMREQARSALRQVRDELMAETR